PKWLLSWMASLLPSQTSHGNGAVHVGKVNGYLKVDNSQRPVTMVVTQNFYSAQVQAQPAANGSATAEQRELLIQIRRTPNNGETVFRFMERHFNTRMVIELRPTDFRRVSAYVATINKRLANRPTEGA
ncbi:MAG: hypothetical protein RSF42_16320, partial [Comamonas sp.]